MKKICAAIMLLIALLALCAPAMGEAALEDGLYSVRAESNSKMFNVTRCMLRVRGGEMTAVLSLHGQSYLYVYPGTAAEAETAPQEDWAPYALDDEGYFCYEFPVDELDVEVPVAAWSKKSEKWYDRTLIFHSDILRPCDRRAADGRYAAQAEIDGMEVVGCTLVVRDGEMTAQFEVPGCEALCLGAPEQASAPEGGEAFALALPSLDREIEISALVGGTWEAHRLYIPAASLAEAKNVPEDGEYSIDCQSDSGLFRIASCVLRVEDGRMTAEITVEKDSYAYIWPGASADALRAPEESRIPAVEGEGGWSYALPLESLDGETIVSTWSESRKAWYERSLSFDTESLAPLG